MPLSAPPPRNWPTQPRLRASENLRSTRLERIGEFEALHDRFQRWREQQRTETGTKDGENESQDSDDALRTVAAVALADGRFDGSGWLMPVHSSNQAAPPYALLNDEGFVLQYVTPAPGLNLRRYLKKEVGVIGQQSYLPALHTSHLTAHRVVMLDRHRR